MKSPLPVIDEIMSLRARSWRLSQKEEALLNEIHSNILYRAEVDRQIQMLEKSLCEWRKSEEPGKEPEPKGAWGWIK